MIHGGAGALLKAQAEEAGQDGASELGVERRPLKAVTITMILMACLMSLAVTVWSSYHSRGLELANASISASNTSHTLANQANSSFKMADTVLVSLVDKVEVEGWSAASTARLRALMLKHMARLPALQGLFIYDETGRWIANSSGTQFDGRNNSDRAYFQYHRQHPGRGVHIGDPIIGRTSGAWVIPVSRRIDHPDGRFAGVALATIKIDFFRKIYEGLDIGSDGRILMTLDDGTLLLRVPFDTGSIGRDTREKPLFRQHATDVEIDGEAFLYSQSRVADYPAQIAVLRSKDVALRPWRESATLSYLALFVLIAGLLLLGRRVIRQVALRDRLQRDLLATKTALETANASLSAMAYVDGLTELFNRRYYEQTWEREHRRAFRNRTSLAVMMIDVDYFKRYNDRYGHLAGDECLSSIAQTIRRGLRRSGDLAARYGGEEFVVLLPDTDLAGAREVAEKIHADLAALALRHEASPHGTVTISIGAYAAMPERSDDDERTFVARADAALYRAKEQGRNRTAV